MQNKSSFYETLKQTIASLSGDVWVETALEGEEAGNKTLHTGSLPDGTTETPRKTGDTTDKGETRQKTRNVSCGTEPHMFRERVGRTPRLVICGGGHVSMPIIHIGKMVGFTVTVLEDRPKFADNARRAGADEVFCVPFEEGMAGIEGNSDTWFVIVTRGHRYDTVCLEAALQKPHAYIGMMGSRRRTAIVKENLEQKGYSHDLLESVYTPIGLKIKAETPEEIAISIMAEIIQVKNERKQSGGYTQEMLEALAKPEERKKVLATIIGRKGSAPRSVGTKMLIYEDGSMLETIGGGCAESDVVQKAILMMRTGTPKFQICRVDMTSDEAEEAGMVCGGVIDVMLEEV